MAYMIATSALQDRVDLLRGQLATVHGSIACQLVELLMLCRKLPPYEDASPEPIPERLSECVASLRETLRMDGPLDAWRCSLQGTLSRLSRRADLLELAIGAAVMTISDVWGATRLTFKLYGRRPDARWLADDLAVTVMSASVEYLGSVLAELAEADTALARMRNEIFCNGDPILSQATTFMSACLAMLEPGTENSLVDRALQCADEIHLLHRAGTHDA